MGALCRAFGAIVGMGLAAAVAAQPATPPLELASGAPDRHVVVRGDTLWAISARFLDSPWRWPELWQLNREQIDNPHLIYPGDVVYLDRSGAQPRLRVGRPVAGGSGGGSGGVIVEGSEPRGIVRLSPSVRSEPNAEEAIPTIEPASIQAFINRPLIVDAQGLATHPRIVATQDGRVHLSRGDLAYVRGLDRSDITDWHVYRPARPLLDPKTRQPIAWETLHIGSAQMIRDGDPATFRIQTASEEISEGDRLMPAERITMPPLAPRPPAAAVNGRILSVYRGLDQVGRNSVVAIDLGRDHGLAIGHVLAVQSTGREIVDRQTSEKIRLPNETIGQLLLFRVFDRVAYGLIVHAGRAISVGASVTNP